MPVMHKPVHPGEIVREALFNETNLTVGEIAGRLKIDRSTLSRLLNRHAGISPDMAYRLSLFLNTSAEMWINIQRDYDLWQVMHKLKKLKIEPFKKMQKAA